MIVLKHFEAAFLQHVVVLAMRSPRTTAFSSRQIDRERTRPLDFMLANRSLLMNPLIASSFGFNCLARSR
jgi:hypothetical protein